MFIGFLKRKKLYLFMAIVTFYFASVPADLYAMPVPSVASGIKDTRASDYKKVASILDLDIVKEKLLELGLTEDEINARLKSLSDEELGELAQKADTLEIGSGGGTFLAITFFALLVFIVFLFHTHTVKVEPRPQQSGRKK